MEPHRHHIIPKFYLKGFATDENPKMIWRFQRGMRYNPGTHKRNNPALLSPTAVAWEEDFYAIPSITGNVNYSAIETEVLARAEIAARPTIECVRKAELPKEEDRATLVQYIILLWRRVKSHRALSDERWPQYAIQQVENIKRALEMAKRASPPTSEGERNLAKVQDMLESFAESRVVPKQIQNSMLLHSYEKMEEELLTKKWILLRNTTGTPFITSDAPVFFNRIGGLKNSDLTVPFSKDVALWASNEPSQDATIEPTEFMVRMINRRSVTDNYEMAFASIPDRWVLTLIEKSPYPSDQLH